MSGARIKNLGGQERRWLAISNELSGRAGYKFIINKSYYDIGSESDIKIDFKPRVVLDWKYSIVDRLAKNIIIMISAMGASQVHYCGNALNMLPSAIFLSLLGKKVSYSFNGVSLFYLKAVSFKSFICVKFMQKLSFRIELLNPRLLDEGWVDEEKAVFAPPVTYVKHNNAVISKQKKIVFCGHLYPLKGVALLVDLIKNSNGRGFAIDVYGDSVDGNAQSHRYMRWLRRETKKRTYLSLSHSHDMSSAYLEASVVLSIQTISNYPSQVVMEGLINGASVCILDTGDSREFGDQPGIFYIPEGASIEEIWSIIESASDYARVHFRTISEVAKKKFSVNHQVESFESNVVWDQRL